MQTPPWQGAGAKPMVKAAAACDTCSQRRKRPPARTTEGLIPSRCLLLAEHHPSPAVARRLAWIPDKQMRRAAAQRFARGESVKALAHEYQIPGGSQAIARTEYCLKQEIVEQNPALWLAPTRDEIRVARGEPNRSDWAWLACRAHVSGYRIDQLRR